MTEDERIDLIYYTVDRLMCAGDFAKVDEMLDGVNLEDLTITEMLSYLTITLTSCDELKSRAKFYERVYQRLLVIDPQRVERLLRGLKEYGHD